MFRDLLVLGIEKKVGRFWNEYSKILNNDFKSKKSKVGIYERSNLEKYNISMTEITQS